jgi:hypothetical protein
MTTTSPPRTKPTTFDDSDLNDIFNQWNPAQEGTANNPIDTDTTPSFSNWIHPTERHQKRRLNNPRTLLKTETTTVPLVSPTTAPIPPPEHPPPPPVTTSNYYDNLNTDSDDEQSPSFPSHLLQQNSQPSQATETDGSETDLNPPHSDSMSTDSRDSSYQPPSQAPSDHLSVDVSDDDLSAIYADQRHPPQRMHPAPFDLMDFEAAISQQALLHYHQLDDHVQSRLPTRYNEFHELLSQAVRTNQDPADLEKTVHSWSPNHNP